MTLDNESNTRLRQDVLDAMANQGRRAIKSGCVVTPNGTQPPIEVDIASGVALFDANKVTVSGQSVVLTTADATFDRYDIVVINASGTASAITGTPSANPATPDVDMDTYVALARVLVSANTTSIITNDIKDLRILYLFGPPGTGYVVVDSVFPDSTNGPAQNLVGNSPTSDFGASTDQHVYFSFVVPDDADVTADFQAESRYCMDTSFAGDVKSQLSVNVLSDADDQTPASATETTTETWTVPGTAEEFDVRQSTVLKISNANITAIGQTVHCKFSRLASDAADTHTGLFQVDKLRLKYTRA